MNSGNWVPKSLGELIDVKHGFAFQSEFFRESPIGHILLTPGNFEIGGGFKGDKLKYYDGPIPEDYILKEDDLIITMTDLSKQGDTLGYPARVPKPQNRLYLHNQRLGKAIIKPDAPITIGFLYYLLRSSEYRHEVLASATGSTVRHTAPDRIKAFKFLLPPLPEQRAIAHILGSLDDKIELNRKMNKTLEELAQAIFTSWFVNFDPVRAKAEGRQPFGMDAATAALFPDAFKDSELGEIPQGWQLQGLDQIADYLNGLALQKFPATTDEYLPVIKIAELRRGFTDSSNKASPTIDPKYIIDDGDILFSWSGSLEVVIWCGGRGALNQHLFKVSSKNYPKWFYYLWTRHYLANFQQIAAAKATTMGHIQRHHLAQALTVAPDSAVMAAADQIIRPLLEKYIQTNLEVRALTEVRDTLLPKLLSGELRIRDAERFLEERGL